MTQHPDSAPALKWVKRHTCVCAMLVAVCCFDTLFHPPFILGQENTSTDDYYTAVQTDTTVQRDAWFGKDKAYHVLGSFMIVCTGTWIHGQACKNGFGQDIQFGAGLALSLGLTKEFIDKYLRGKFFSGKDIAADIVGVLMGCILLSLL